MILISDFSVVIAITLSITAVLASGIWFIHNHVGNTSKYPLSGGFFTELGDYPALTLFVHKSALNGKNPIPLSNPEGIKDGYYFIASFDRDGRDYLGQVPPEVFEKLYKKGYDIFTHTPQQLTEIFREVRAATNTLFTNENSVADEKYFQEKIDFARRQLEHL